MEEKTSSKNSNSEIMKSPMKDKIVAVIGWVAWIILSPIILYKLLTSEIAAGLLILLAIGGGGIGFLLIPVIIVFIICGSIGQNACERNGFAKGIVFVLIPIIGLCLSLAYNTENSEKSKEAKADTLRLLADLDMIEVDGIYTGSIPLRYELYGMLVKRRISFVESDVAVAEWLFDLAKDKKFSMGKQKVISIYVCHLDKVIIRTVSN
jgi:hypothetical protein